MKVFKKEDYDYVYNVWFKNDGDFWVAVVATAWYGNMLLYTHNSDGRWSYIGKERYKYNSYLTDDEKAKLLAVMPDNEELK